MGENRKGRAAALLPILIFLLVLLGSGFIIGDFYSIPAIVVFLIALPTAFVRDRELGFVEKIKLATQDVGDENVITMCLIFLATDAFIDAARAAGGVDSTVNLGLSILPSSVAMAGLFFIGRFISISIGTSMGTITVPASTAVGTNQKAGFSTAVCAGAMVGGVMSEDNLSVISDATIATVETQGCETRDKFGEDFLIVLPAATATIPLFLVLGKDASLHIQDSLDYSLLRVVPYMVVLVGVLTGVNVFLALMTGIVLSLMAGATTNVFGVGEMFTHVGAGITGMCDIIVVSVIVACIIALVKEYERIAFTLPFIKKRINGERGGELGAATLALLVNMYAANNTVVIVMAGPIAKEISDNFDVTPRCSASLLDMFSSMRQGLIPYGAQFLAAASLTGLTLFEIIPYCFYPVLMGVSGLLFILIKKRHGKVLV